MPGTRFEALVRQLRLRAGGHRNGRRRHPQRIGHCAERSAIRPSLMLSPAIRPRARQNALERLESRSDPRDESHKLRLQLPRGPSNQDQRRQRVPGFPAAPRHRNDGDAALRNVVAASERPVGKTAATRTGPGAMARRRSKSRYSTEARVSTAVEAGHPVPADVAVTNPSICDSFVAPAVCGSATNLAIYANFVTSAVFRCAGCARSRCGVWSGTCGQRTFASSPGTWCKRSAL
jgi:hypothetical protein